MKNWAGIFSNRANAGTVELSCNSLEPRPPDLLVGGDTLEISRWGCAAGTLEPVTYPRAIVVQLNFATLY